jgi:hypothetical protein
MEDNKMQELMVNGEVNPLTVGTPYCEEMRAPFFILPLSEVIKIERNYKLTS